MRAIAAAAVLLLAACAGTPADPGTGLSVLVERGPLQPVSQPGQVNAAPVPGASVRVSTVAGREIVTAPTDTAGRVRFSLGPGSYRVAVLTCPGAVSLPAPVDATVTAGGLTPLGLECDTGIR